MTAITRAGVDGVEGEVRERVVETLRDTVPTAGVLLSQREGDVWKVVETIGSTLSAPYKDDDKIREYFGRRRGAGNDCSERVASGDT